MIHAEHMIGGKRKTSDFFLKLQNYYFYLYKFVHLIITMNKITL